MTKQRDYVPVIAIWELLSVFGVGYLLVMFLFVTYASYSEAAYFGEPNWPTGVALLIAELILGLGYILVALLGGIGLLRREEWGRRVSILHAILSLVLFPIGTVIGALSWRYLTREDIKRQFVPADGSTRDMEA